MGLGVGWPSNDGKNAHADFVGMFFVIGDERFGSCFFN